MVEGGAILGSAVYLVLSTLNCNKVPAPPTGRGPRFGTLAWGPGKSEQQDLIHRPRLSHKVGKPSVQSPVQCLVSPSDSSSEVRGVSPQVFLAGWGKWAWLAEAMPVTCTAQTLLQLTMI